jgi:hypothetical protein
LIAEGTAVGAERIVQAVRLEGTSSPEWIGRGMRIERIRAQLAEVFRVDGERQWQEKEQQEKENPHGNPPKSGTTSGLAYSPHGDQRKQPSGATDKVECPCFLSRPFFFITYSSNQSDRV